MLDALREGTRGWIAWAIIGLLCIPFALWGIGNYAGLGSSPSKVAEVNGVSITRTDLSKAYRNRIERLQQAFGPNYVPDDSAALRKEVLEDLVSNRLLQQQATQAGYRINNQQLLGRIHSMPVFNVGGKFNVDVYRVRLQRAGYSPRGFENSIRQNLTVAQLRAGIAGSAIATGSEFDRFVALANEQRKIGYVTVDADRYLGQAQPTEDEVKAWYQSHKQAFMTPETVSIAYIDLNAKDIAARVPVNEQALHSLYQKKKNTFVKKEQRRAAHILIAPNGKGAEGLQKAKAKAETVLKKIHNGADFGKLAKKYSDDAGSAKKGGELGWIQRGELGESFEKALFGAAKVGAVVGPVKTQYGYHIIKLEGIRKPKQQSFEEVRDRLVEQYRQKKAEDKFYKLGNQLSNLAFDHSDSLEPIHKALKLPIQHIKGVTRDKGEGIAADPRVRNVAFSDEVYKNGKNHLAKLGDTHVVVLRDVNRQPAQLKPLSDVKPQIVKTLKQRAAAEQAAQVAKGIAQKVDSGESLKTAAGDFKVQPPTFVGRNDQDVPKPILKAAFSANAPADGSKVNAGTVALNSGDQAVYVVADVKPGKTASVTGSEKKAMVNQLVAGHARADLAAYVADLRKHADIKVQQENIDNY